MPQRSLLNSAESLEPAIVAVVDQSQEVPTTKPSSGAQTWPALSFTGVLPGTRRATVVAVGVGVAAPIAADVPAAAITRLVAMLNIPARATVFRGEACHSSSPGPAAVSRDTRHSEDRLLGRDRCRRRNGQCRCRAA